jgi:hypothetical protein
MGTRSALSETRRTLNTWAATCSGQVWVRLLVPRRWDGGAREDRTFTVEALDPPGGRRCSRDGDNVGDLLCGWGRKPQRCSPMGRPLPTPDCREPSRADNLTSQTALEDDDQVATGGPVVGTQCRGTPAVSGEAPTRARWRMTRQIVGGGSTRGPAAPGGPRVSAVRRVPVPLTRYSGSTRWPDRVFCGLRFADPGNRCDARGIGRLFCEPVNQAGVQGARCGRRLWFGPRFRALRGFLVTWSGKCSGI